MYIDIYKYILYIPLYTYEREPRKKENIPKYKGARYEEHSRRIDTQRRRGRRREKKKVNQFRGIGVWSTREEKTKEKEGVYVVCKKGSKRRASLLLFSFLFRFYTLLSLMYMYTCKTRPLWRVSNDRLTREKGDQDRLLLRRTYSSNYSKNNHV